MALSPKEWIEVRNTLANAFKENPLREFLATFLSRDYDLYQISGAAYPESLLAMVKAADKEMWLYELILKAAENIPADPELSLLVKKVQPIAPVPGIDHFDACCLCGQHVMVNRGPLRKALRELIKSTGKRILVVQDATLPGKASQHRTKSGKSHTVQFVAYIRQASGRFELTWIDLEPLGKALGQGALVQPIDIARKMVTLMKFNPKDLLPDEPFDTQWSRWVLNFCDILEAQLLQDGRSWWIVIDGFNVVPLPQPTLDLVKELANRINVSLERVRLVLLGYSDTFPPEVLPNVETERVDRGVTQNDVIKFFEQACLQKQIKPDTERATQFVIDSLQGLDPQNTEFFENLGLRLREHLHQLESGG
jgi:hypothetical protein